jgi:hypothetical protein
VPYDGTGIASDRRRRIVVVEIGTSSLLLIILAEWERVVLFHRAYNISTSVQLLGLFNKDDTTMAEHIDKYSRLVEQINYHVKPTEKWSNEWISRTFIGTISSEKWGAYEDSLSESINMLPS